MTGEARLRALAPRSDFGVLEDVTYLNAASIGLIPLPVRSETEAFARDIAGRGTVGFDDAAETRILETAREVAALLLGADSTGIAITNSATEAIAQVAWWLRPGPETNIVSLDIEFPSVTYPWMRVAEDTGAQVRLVRAAASPENLTIDDVAALVDDQTAAISISHVQYATGLRFDPAQLASLAHSHGALLVLDATQSAGVVPLSVLDADVDVLVAGAYKWLGGSFGAGICYLRPELRDRFRPPFVGWRSTADPFEFDASSLSLAKGARRMEYSTRSYEAGVALGGAIQYILGIGVDRILEHNLKLGSYLSDGLDALGAVVLSPREDHRRAGIVTARFPEHDGDAVNDRLATAGVIISPRFGATRFSVHMFNNEDDVVRALDVLDAILHTTGSADMSICNISQS